ncbi:hypothetical protein evm_007768 [Chilo suppressalis]|nr:hypothetical protein evm_007768 [Chilo suppressalis]
MSGLQVCRVCLAHHSRMYSILNGPLQKVFENIIEIPLVMGDKWPTCLCYICYHMIRKLHKFIGKSLKANELLLQLISSESEITIDSLNMIVKQQPDISWKFSMSPMESFMPLYPEKVKLEPTFNIVKSETDVEEMQDQNETGEKLPKKGKLTNKMDKENQLKPPTASIITEGNTATEIEAQLGNPNRITEFQNKESQITMDTLNMTVKQQSDISWKFSVSPMESIVPLDQEEVKLEPTFNIENVKSETDVEEMQDQIDTGSGFWSTRVINSVVEATYLVLKLTDRYCLKVVQIYAPTSTHSDQTAEAMMPDISKAIMNTTKAHYIVVMGDFNALVGVQASGDSKIGNRYRAQKSLESNACELPRIAGVLKRWTRRSPDNVTRNEIEFIVTDKKHILTDFSEINGINALMNINFKAERFHLVKPTLRPTPLHIVLGSEKFQLGLQNRFDVLANTGNVDEKTDAGFPLKCKNKMSKLSSRLVLMKERREMLSTLSSSNRTTGNTNIRKLMRRELRWYNTYTIEAAIEQNIGSKVFAQQLERPSFFFRYLDATQRYRFDCRYNEVLSSRTGRPIP